MITIALIGSSSFCQQAAKLAASDMSYHLQCYEYKEPTEAPTLLQHIEHCDVLMFSGSLPYAFCEEQLATWQQPIVYLRQDVQALAITLLKAVQLGYDLTRVSLDYRHEEEWQNLSQDLLQPPVNKTMCLNPIQPLQPVYNFHTQALRNKEVDLAITSIHAVYDQLISARYNAIHIVDTDSDILHTLAKAKEQALLARATTGQIAVVLIEEQHCTEEQLNDLAKLFNTTLIRKDKLAVIYSTVGKVEAVIHHPLFLKLYGQLDERVRLSVGSGQTTDIANHHARMAHLYANSKAFYFMDGKKVMNGPYPTRELQPLLTIDHPKLIELAQQVKLSPQNVLRLTDYASLRKNEAFTAAQLAEFLQVTRRTAERLLKKLNDANCLVVMGEQSINQKGRPSTFYKLRLPTF